ncbi:MAG: 5-formyltetrahydrofolate cyclo-ligase [Pseudomonadota bacterium]
METNPQLYDQMMSTLQELKSSFVTEASTIIQKRVLLMEEFRTALRVGLYAPFGNEVKTDMLFTEGDRNRKELYYPVRDAKNERLVFFRISNLAELRPSLGGIHQLIGATSGLRDVNTLETLIITGLAFDLHGGRLGFSKGIFDQTLLDFRGKRIAIAYDFQIVPQLPMVLRKQKVDLIITESRVIRC